MNEDSILQAFGDIPVQCLGGLLAHITRIYQREHRLYGPNVDHIAEYAERFELDVELLRGAINGDTPDRSILNHFKVRVLNADWTCDKCGAIHQDLYYRYAK